MKIIKITRKKNGLYEIILSDKTSLSFYDDTIIKYNLLKPRDISQKELEEIILYNDEIKAFNAALKYITAKLRTKTEIDKKLTDYDKSVRDRVIKKLESYGYLNDDLYIKSYVADQVNLKLNGPKKIEKDLVKLGFNINKIQEVINTYDKEIWISKGEKILSKKINSNHKLSNNMLKSKLKNDLIKLGYDNSVISVCLEKMVLKDDKDILKSEFNKEYKKLSRKYNNNDLKNKLKFNLYKKGFSLTEIDKLLNEYLD